MAKVVFIRVSTEHDVVWRPGRLMLRTLRFMGLEAMAERLEAAAGKPFLSQMTLPYLVALARQHDPEARHELLMVEGPEHTILAQVPMDTEVAIFTTNTPGAPGTYRIAQALAARGVWTIVGGIHPSVLPDEAARYVDTVFTGEAEGAMDRLMEDLSKGELQPRYQGGRIRDLAGLPTPAWNEGGVDQCPWVVPVQTSRGCKNACAFCSTTRFQGARRRHRPVEDVVAEIRELQERGILTPDKTVFFTDNNIVTDSDYRRGINDTRYARELFAALEPLGIDWVGQGEIGIADDPELLELAARSGCISLLVGFETLDQSNLDAVHKACNHVERYEEQIARMHAHGISLIGCFIFGLEHDTPQTIRDTFDFIARNIDVPQVSVLTPYPGTRLYRELEREGRIFSRDWGKYDITQVVFEPWSMSALELDQGYTWLVESLFTQRQMLRRALRFASTKVLPGVRNSSFRGRFSQVYAPNLIYRQLSRIGRRHALSRDVRGHRDLARALEPVA